jgi:hypothetical protein
MSPFAEEVHQYGITLTFSGGEWGEQLQSGNITKLLDGFKLGWPPFNLL